MPDKIKGSPIDDDFVESVGEMIRFFMESRGVKLPDTAALSTAVMNQIREHYAGEQVWIKKRANREVLRQKIKAEYNGHNMNEIMERYQVSRATVYRYCGD